MATSTKKKKIAVLAAALVILTGGAAFAYWTTGGEGSGAAATSNGPSDIEVIQTSEPTAMMPGDPPQALSGTFLNDNAGPVYVGTVTASIASVDKATGAPTGTCDASDYTLADVAMDVSGEVLADDTSTWGGATIQFNNKPSENQDACKGATVNLHYALS